MDARPTLPAERLRDLVHEARERTLELVEDLDDAQLAVPYLEEVNPFLWELGHVAFFYEAFVLRELGHAETLLPDADDLYNSFEVDHLERWHLPLPSRTGTRDYMQRVMDRVVSRLGSASDGRETYLYLLAVLHEGMHDEAFTYMRQRLSYPAPKLGVADCSSAGQRAGPLSGDVEVPGGRFELGAAAGAPFVFDNERWGHPVEIAPFCIARAPVTNSEFSEFVAAGGYQRRDHWSRQGWTWRAAGGAHWPSYWSRGPAGWLRRHFDLWLPLEPHAPVSHVSWYEAEAYCSWAGRRLPTEAEWELAAAGEPAGSNGGIAQHKRRYPWGGDPPSPERANLDWAYRGCLDVGALPESDSAFGCRQMLGNVWEWTASPFYPYPGYVVDHPYREYSAPWFGYRKVLKGGGWATRSLLAHSVYRNFFPPDRNDIIAGFRTCEP